MLQRTNFRNHKAHPRPQDVWKPFFYSWLSAISFICVCGINLIPVPIFTLPVPAPWVRPINIVDVFLLHTIAPICAFTLQIATCRCPAHVAKTHKYKKATGIEARPKKMCNPTNSESKILTDIDMKMFCHQFLFFNYHLGFYETVEIHYAITCG